MRDLCIPIPEFIEKQLMEVEVKIMGDKRKYNFRLESFDWDVEEKSSEKNIQSEIDEKIQNLKRQIENYDKDWRLIQIFNPAPDSKIVQVLFREEEKE
jgi:hypothetical protein